MKKEELRELKARVQRLEALIDSFESDVAILYKNGVDVSSNEDIAKRQSMIQDEIEQVVSDVLLVLDMSGKFSNDEVQIDLPNPGRRPVSDGSLPPPRYERPDERGKPLWVKGKNSNGE